MYTYKSSSQGYNCLDSWVGQEYVRLEVERV